MYGYDSIVALYGGVKRMNKEKNKLSRSVCSITAILVVAICVGLCACGTDNGDGAAESTTLGGYTPSEEVSTMIEETAETDIDEHSTVTDSEVVTEEASAAVGSSSETDEADPITEKSSNEGKSDPDETTETTKAYSEDVTKPLITPLPDGGIELPEDVW